MSLSRTTNQKSEFPVGLTLVLIFTIFFMVRFMNIALSRNIMGNHAYVQMINEGIPMIKAEYYNEDAYVESDVTIESLLLETFWIDKIDIGTVLSFQIPGFMEFQSKNEFLNNDETIGSFIVKDNSIERNTNNESEENKDIKPGVARNPDIVKTLDQSRPEVLIYSSHTAEAFGDAFSNDESKNIIGVGALIEKELEEYYGISVIHDKTMYAADYNSAYIRSREGVKKYLDKYGDFKFILDLHRDGGPKRENITTNINGEDVARLSFGNGKNNPNYAYSSERIRMMVEDMNKNFPGLSKGIITYNRAKSNSYNQDLSKNSYLMEVGSEKSTPSDAMNAAKYIARIIAEEVYRQDNKN